MVKVASRAAELAQAIEQDFPESWIPSAEDPLLVGTFVRLDSGTTAYGPAGIVVLRTDDGTERGLWLLHTVLKSEFARLKPHPGELVAVKYLGKKNGAGGQTYESYRVLVDRKPGETDWDALSDGIDAGPESHESGPDGTDGDTPF